MIGKLLEMHGIDYVISVDDCYSIENDIDDVRATISGILNESPEKVYPHIVGLNKGDLWDQYKDFIIPGENNDTVISTFMEELGEDNLLSIYGKIDDKYHNSDFQEKNRLIAFLKKLVEESYIKEYLTYSSTKEAMQEYSHSLEGASGILWLIDKDFSRVNESAEAGLTLAKNIISVEHEHVPNYIFILSSKEKDSENSEDVIEKEFDEQLKEYNLSNPSFIYYLYKQRIIPDKMDRIAQSLARGFNRKTCYRLFVKYAECLKKGVENTENILCAINQDTLNFLFSKRVPEEGESIWEFLVRFVDLFMQNEYRESLVDSYDELVELITQYTNVTKIVSTRTVNEGTERLKSIEFRKKELYDRYVNNLHLEVTTGDIFIIDDKYYILISQACDSCLRATGERVLDKATLLQICDKVTVNVDQFKYELKVPFFDGLDDPKIDFKKVLSVPFEMLDLCVLNKDGSATLPLRKSVEELIGTQVLYEDRFRKRIDIVNKRINEIVMNSKIVDSCFAEGKKVTEEIRKAYNANKCISPELLNYKLTGVEEENVCYSIKRICRLQEIEAIDIVRKYGNNVSRIGHGFDFTKKHNRR